MASPSPIEWTQHTWNPVVGCSVVSPGCTHCYAMRQAARLERMGVRGYDGLTRPSKAGPVWTGHVRLVESAQLAPLRRRKPTTYFVNSMSDLFHEGLTNAQIDRVFAVMALCPQHVFQVLTKRSARMRAYFADPTVRARIAYAMGALAGQSTLDRMKLGMAVVDAMRTGRSWPLPNVWLGISAEDHERAYQRVPDLLATPAAIRFVSAEPLLGPIEFAQSWLCIGYLSTPDRPLDWIIVGGESGPRARPMHPDWARSIRDQCAGAGVPFFFKQWGSWKASSSNEGYWPVDTATFIRLRRDGTREPDGWAMQCVGKKAAGRLIDERTHDALPEVRL